MEHHLNSQRLIRLKDLSSQPGKPGLIPAAPATIWRWVKEGKFPTPFKLATRTTVWDRDTVEAWIMSKSSNAITAAK